MAWVCYTFNLAIVLQSTACFAIYLKTAYNVLAAAIDSGVWGTPANFNGFRVLASLMERRRSPEANQTLHDVWPSPGLLQYIYTFGGSCPLDGISPRRKFTLRPIKYFGRSGIFSQTPPGTCSCILINHNPNPNTPTWTPPLVRGCM